MKVLHITFHRGCQYDIEYVCEKLNLDIETLFFQDYAADIHPLDRYKVTEQRADLWWQDKEQFYQSFDVIITSDTAPLSRIFLQHIDELKPRLIVWICNRFDYAIEGDKKYCRLLNRLVEQKRIKLIPYTDIERIYCKHRGVNVVEPTIKPIGHRIADRDIIPPRAPAYMEEGDYENGFYVPMYHNDTKFMNLHEHCRSLGVKTFHGTHRGADSLKRFKGIIHLPYAWSTLSFFESLALNIPYLIPSERFLSELESKDNFWFQTDFNEDLLKLSEWYCDEHRDFITYFDDWDDLADKAENTDWAKVREKVSVFSKKHHDETIKKWKEAILVASPRTSA